MSSSQLATRRPAERSATATAEIGVDSAGNVYVSVQEKDAGMQVYGPDGKFIKTLPLPPSLHGFVIHKEDDGEFIYAAVLGEQRVIKANLDHHRFRNPKDLLSHRTSRPGP